MKIASEAFSKSSRYRVAASLAARSACLRSVTSSMCATYWNAFPSESRSTDAERQMSTKLPSFRT
jgi:hypothetical protein